MRPPLLALAALLVPAAVLAEPLDIDENAGEPVLDAPVLGPDDGVQSGDARVGDLEDQIEGRGALALEPKLDLTDEQPEGLSGKSALDHRDPEPAPGFRLKIPTN